MARTKLRQQGGAVILTIPNEVAVMMGWRVGTVLDVESKGQGISVTPAKRYPRGRRTVKELLSGVDSDDVAEWRREMVDDDDIVSSPIGRELI